MTKPRHFDDTRNHYGLISEVTERVPVIHYADLLRGPCGLRRVDTPRGIRWVGRCPIRPNHTRMVCFEVDKEGNS